VEPTFDLRIGEVREQLRALPENSVHAVVTSPPYWNLREYGTPPQWWGVSAVCASDEQHRLQDDGHCHRCGGWYGELGQEPTPQEFAAHLVEVFREVRRVLRPDGVCFVNMGDSYAANRSYQVPSTKAGEVGNGKASKVPPGLKPKDLCLVPQRLAIALQDDGWWVRADVVWWKPNAMPESVEDRPARDHENVLMLTKSERYFYDRVAVMEASTANPDRQGGTRRGSADWGHTRDTNGNNGLAQKLPTMMRNLRSVWAINTESYPGAHFAVMAKKVAERCVLAATSEKGCCAKCGAPIARVVETTSLDRNELPPDHPEWRPSRYDDGKAGDPQSPGAGQRYSEAKTVGWQATCACADETVPCTVLDPFLGSGTTAVVARRLGRNSVGVELGDEFAELARERMESWWKDVTPSRREVPDDQLALI
jgi:DNA modification methylase